MLCVLIRIASIQVRRHYRDVFSISTNMKVCCVFSLESPRGDSDVSTKHMVFIRQKKIPLIYPKYAAIRLFSKGLKNEFDTAVVNEPSVFEPLKFYRVIYSNIILLKLNSL